MNTRLTCVFACLSLTLLTTPLLADGPSARCTGTYLIEEDGGARDFWTFEPDGTFFGTTSTQPLFNFSNQQGSWRKVGRDGIRGVLFAFVWNDDNTLLTTARIDIEVQTDSRRCETISGSLVVRTFEDGEDPLDPSTDEDDPIAEDTFSGRRVVVGR